MNSFEKPESDTDVAAAELRAIEQANVDLWFPHPSRAPIRRHPLFVGGWMLITSAVVAFSLAFGLEPGWKGWLSAILLLVSAGGSVAGQRWLQRDRGVNLAWFPPGNVYKHDAKTMWPFYVALLVAVPLAVFWLLGKPYWLSFFGVLTIVVLITWWGDRQYRVRYPIEAI